MEFAIDVKIKMICESWCDWWCGCSMHLELVYHRTHIKEEGEKSSFPSRFDLLISLKGKARKEASAAGVYSFIINYLKPPPCIG